MEMLAAVDPYVFLALSIGLLLTLCLGILVLLHDPEWQPPRVVSRTLQCAERGQYATVEFVEEMHTGLISRTVRHCSLRGAGTCSEECRYLAQPTAGPHIAPAAPSS